MANTPWSRLRTPPATIATTSAIHGLPVATTVENPATAPISIIPSTPRFSTPDRSAKISPIAANSRTVPVPTPAARTSWKSIRRGSSVGVAVDGWRRSMRIR